MSIKKSNKDGAGSFLLTMGFAAAIIFLCAVCAVTFIVARFASGEADETVVADAERRFPVIVIDAGHGGIDGGAVSPDGTAEKEINLSVALRLEALCRTAGLDCIMTRCDDRMLVDDGVKDHRKMQDLKNRLAVVSDVTESGDEAVFISIHMNNFSVPKYSGLQVWYSPNKENSRELASYIQSYAHTWLDRENDREIKQASSAIYILDRITVPAVLVECGFLSNPGELEKLKTDSYRNDIAAVIFAAMCDWLSASPDRYILSDRN